jgi:hypothetical protein
MLLPKVTYYDLSTYPFKKIQEHTKKKERISLTGNLEFKK